MNWKIEEEMSLVSEISQLLSEGSSKLEQVTILYNELRSGRNSPLIKKVREQLSNSDMVPIPWLRKAQRKLHSIKKKTQGKHHVYICLIDGFKHPYRFGAYVGESFYVPEKRFLVHKEGGKLAARCNRRMLCLLPSLYEHLNPLSRTEAKELEPKIAQELQDLMIKTKWG